MTAIAVAQSGERRDEALRWALVFGTITGCGLDPRSKSMSIVLHQLVYLCREPLEGEGLGKEPDTVI